VASLCTSSLDVLNTFPNIASIPPALWATLFFHANPVQMACTLGEWWDVTVPRNVMAIYRRMVLTIFGTITIAILLFRLLYLQTKVPNLPLRLHHQRVQEAQVLPCLIALDDFVVVSRVALKV
jgi:hypothetical protein